MKKNKKVVTKSKPVVAKYQRVPGQVCENDVSVLKAHRNDLCIELLQVAKKQRMVEHQVGRFKNNPMLCNEFSFEELTGLLYETISQVLNKFDEYVALRKKGKRPKMKLDTFGMVKGYFINAYINNVSKLYTKHKTEKRSALKSTISLDYKMDDENKNSLEALISYEPAKEMEHNETISLFIKHLRQYDRKINEQLKMRGDLADKKKSKLAHLFVCLINPRYKGDQDKIKDRLDWKDHYFKKNRSLLFEKLQKEFNDLGKEALGFVIERDSDRLPGMKEKEKADKTPVSYRVNTCFSMKPVGKTNRYCQTIILEKLEKGVWVAEKKKEKVLVDKNSSLTFDSAKAKLKDLTAKDLASFQVLARK